MRLAWPGRTWEPGAFAGGRQVGALPTLVERCESATAPAGRLVQGDALAVAAHLAASGLAGRVRVAYVDPPYLSQADYEHEARLDGRADGRVRRSAAYGDRWGDGDEGVGAYLEMLAPRLEALAHLLADDGTLWVQLDWRAAYLARIVLDEIFGRDGFRNEIVWRRAPNLGRQAASAQFGRTLDTLLVYGKPGARLVPPLRKEPIEKSALRFDEAGRPFTTAPRGDYTDASIARLEAEGRVHRTASGKVYIKYFLVKNDDGAWCRERRVDALWTDVAPLRHASVAERTGYPTQKPLALLERIIACASSPGDWVVDVFGGSGTTAVAAHRLGRRFALGDASATAIGLARARLLSAGAGLSLERFGEGLRPECARVTVGRTARGRYTVRLDAPSEPLAWAVGVVDGEGVWCTLWHGERKPGTRPAPPPAVAEVTAPERARQLVVRAFGDDGTVAETAVDLPRKGHDKQHDERRRGAGSTA